MLDRSTGRSQMVRLDPLIPDADDTAEAGSDPALRVVESRHRRQVRPDLAGRAYLALYAISLAHPRGRKPNGHHTSLPQARAGASSCRPAKS